VGELELICLLATRASVVVGGLSGATWELGLSVTWRVDLALATVARYQLISLSGSPSQLADQAVIRVLNCTGRPWPVRRDRELYGRRLPRPYTTIRFVPRTC